MQKVYQNAHRAALQHCSRAHTSCSLARRRLHRNFHASARLDVVKPFVLADIGEGIKEVQIIQWFVQPGARVEQFDKLCEVASDKAIVEITSRFDGVIKALHYEPEDMAKVGKPLCDIDIQQDIAPEDEALITPASAEQAGEPGVPQQPQKAAEQAASLSQGLSTGTQSSSSDQVLSRGSSTQASFGASTGNSPVKHASLATPAVRGLLKEHGVKIEDVRGTGKDGRVLKEDVQNFVSRRMAVKDEILPIRRTMPDNTPQSETTVSLTPVQSAMFRTMTKSLEIPMFLFSEEVDFTAISAIRAKLRALKKLQQKLTYLPFVIKAISLALYDYPVLNARVETGDGSPKIVMRSKHNIGVAMDTPQGLIVPNIKNVGALSIFEIAEQITHLQAQALAAKLSPADLSGGTLTVSNIGNIGGTYVAPILVPGEVAILGMGKLRDTPAFDETGVVVRKTIGTFSWSADHRVVDGATMARMGVRVQELLEEPHLMMTEMR